MTQNQLTELLETEGAKTLLEGAEERGWVIPAELEAFALEHELSDIDVEELTRELERIGLEIGQPVAAAKVEDEEEEKPAEAPAPVASAPASALPNNPNRIAASLRFHDVPASDGRES